MEVLYEQHICYEIPIESALTLGFVQCAPSNNEN